MEKLDNIDLDDLVARRDGGEDVSVIDVREVAALPKAVAP